MKINPNNLRKHVLDMVYEKQSGHIGGSFSIAELTAYLYNNYDLIKGKDNLLPCFEINDATKVSF